MKSFAGVLAHQLIKYIENQVDTVVLHTRSLAPMPNTVNTMNFDNEDECSPLTAPSVLTLSDDEQMNNDSTGRTVRTRRPVEVIEEITDVNGIVHQAVRIGYNTENPGRAQPKICSQHGNKLLSCQKSRTRVMCLQCKVPLCYPLGKRQSEDRLKYCFITHVSLIEKKTNTAKKVKYVSMKTRL